jgi:predicted 3-demethylubiquinone-9 3-methyltransferase (glyoxalase superfamily)
MQKIIPSLWFDDNAEEAVNFYVSVFKNSKIDKVSRYTEAGPRKPGSVVTLEFQLEGQKFIAINGGPHFSFTPAISFLVDCKTQDEVDKLWNTLLEGGEAEQCGWLRDKFGLSWQIVPSALGEMISDKDPEKVKRVTEAMLQMVKLDIDKLKEAYHGNGTTVPK